jgi:hypothetical protein
MGLKAPERNCRNDLQVREWTEFVFTKLRKLNVEWISCSSYIENEHFVIGEGHWEVESSPSIKEARWIGGIVSS